MIRYIIARVLAAVPILFGVSLVVFLLMNALGNPMGVLFGTDNLQSNEQQALLREQLGLDRPLHERYLDFLGNAVQGDLGRSFQNRLPVTEAIAQHLRPTIELAVAALLIGSLLGVALGVLAALHRNSWVDLAVMTLATWGVSIPSFWLGMVLILVFGVSLNWLPITGAGSAMNLIMPATTLALIMAGPIARMTRSGMINALREDYVRTAQAKGLPGSTVVVRHALRNALIPVVTVIGLEAGHLLTGTVLIETVFARPGIGRLTVAAINGRDIPMVQGVVVFIAAVYVLVNLAVDLLYGVIDPRVRHRSG